MPEIGELDLGKLTRAEKERRTTARTVKKYTNKKGQKAFVGTAALSESQKLGCKLKTLNLPLREYPPAFGNNLLHAFEMHRAGALRRDLRFKPQFNQDLSVVEQFHYLPLGDTWEEAGLLECVDYLMTSKKLRRDINTS